MQTKRIALALVAIIILIALGFLFFQEYSSASRKSELATAKIIELSQSTPYPCTHSGFQELRSKKLLAVVVSCDIQSILKSFLGMNKDAVAKEINERVVLPLLPGAPTENGLTVVFAIPLGRDIVFCSQSTRGEIAASWISTYDEYCDL